MGNHRNDRNGTFLTQNSSGNSLSLAFSTLLVWLHSQPYDFTSLWPSVSDSQIEGNVTSKFQFLYCVSQCLQA